jgi:hypothetical protein
MLPFNSLGSPSCSIYRTFRAEKDGKDEDLTAESEMIKAFRDTWELGIHSYLTCLRDRLLLARELLTSFPRNMKLNR